MSTEGEADADSSDAPMPPSEARNRSGNATLNVSVPAEAKVFVNGQATTSKGAERQYISRRLERGFKYKYEVRAEFERDGETLEQTKVVNLWAGSDALLVFDFDSPETTITLNVPADAKVFLAGNETKSSGPVRVFTTDSLAASEEWTDYEIKVVVDRDGRNESKVQTVSLKAGDSRTLTFDFNEAKIADAR